MTTQRIADRLVALGRSNQLDSAYDELFAHNAEAFEMEGTPNHHTIGLDKIKEKAAKWAEDVVQIHGFTISDPVVGGDYFSVSMFIDLETKSRGREAMDEICVYKTENGKITEERFFYGM